MPRWSLVVIALVILVEDARADCAESERDARGDCPKTTRPKPRTRVDPRPPPPPVTILVKRWEVAAPPTIAAPATKRPQPARPTVAAPARRTATGKPPPAKQIAMLRELVKDTPAREADERSDYRYRLAEALAAVHDAAPSPAKLREAVKAYKELTEDPGFKRYARADEALFHYAGLLTSGKQAKEARALYMRLIKEYPISKYVPDAYVAFAEYYVETNRLDDAAQFYDKVTKYPRAAVYWYAMYKLATIDVARGRAVEAFERMYRVAIGAKDSTFGRAAISELPRIYAEIGKPELALKTFERIDASRAVELARAVGLHFLAIGKHAHARVVLRETAARDSDPRRACDDAVLAFSASISIGALHLVADAEELARAATKGGASCTSQAGALILDVAMLRHHEASKTRTPATFDQAHELYARAATLAMSKDRHAAFARGRAICAWQRAEVAKTDAIAWASAGELLQAADTPADVGEAAIDAWDNALRVTRNRPPPPLASRIRAGLTKLGTARARALLQAMR